MMRFEVNRLSKATATSGGLNAQTETASLLQLIDQLLIKLKPDGYECAQWKRKTKPIFFNIILDLQQKYRQKDDSDASLQKKAEALHLKLQTVRLKLAKQAQDEAARGLRTKAESRVQEFDTALNKLKAVDERKCNTIVELLLAFQHIDHAAKSHRMKYDQNLDNLFSSVGCPGSLGLLPNANQLEAMYLGSGRKQSFFRKCVGHLKASEQHRNEAKMLQLLPVTSEISQMNEWNSLLGMFMSNITQEDHSESNEVLTVPQTQIEVEKEEDNLPLEPLLQICNSLKTGMLLSECTHQVQFSNALDQSLLQGLHFHDKGRAFTDYELIQGLIRLLRGSIHLIVPLSQSRLCWSDFTSTQAVIMEFIQGGIFHYNLQQFVNIQAREASDAVSQAFVCCMQGILRALDSELGSLLQVQELSPLKSLSALEAMSLFEFYDKTAYLRNSLSKLAALCRCRPTFDMIRLNPKILMGQWQRIQIPNGVQLLSYLYESSLSCHMKEQKMTTLLFESCMQPFLEEMHKSLFQNIDIRAGNYTSCRFNLPQLPSFLSHLKSELEMSLLQYSVLKEFDECIPLLSFMQQLTKYCWHSGHDNADFLPKDMTIDLVVSPEYLETAKMLETVTTLTFDAQKLDALKKYHGLLANNLYSAINILLSHFSSKNKLHQVASEAAYKARKRSEEKSMEKANEELLLSQRKAREKQKLLAQDLKSAASMYAAAKKARIQAEKQADRNKIIEDERKRSEAISEASALLEQQTSDRMKVIQKKIDRISWQMRRFDLQPKRLKFLKEDGIAHEEGKKVTALEESVLPSTFSQDNTETGINSSNKETVQKEALKSGNSKQVESLQENIRLDLNLSSASETENVAIEKSVVEAKIPNLQEVARNAIDNLNARSQANSITEDWERDNGKEDNKVAPLEDADEDMQQQDKNQQYPVQGKPYAIFNNKSFDVSLPEGVEICVVQLVHLHYKCISKLCVRYFIEELKVMNHFSALRKLYLMEAGDFVHAFLDQILKGDVLLTELRQRDLDIAFENSGLSLPYSSSSIEDFSMKMHDVHGREVQHLHLDGKNIQALEAITLQYKPSFPFSCVTTEEVLSKYKKVFSFLVCLRHSGFILNRIWQTIVFYNREIRQSHMIRDEKSSYTLMLLHGMHHEMSHFLTTVQTFICNKIHAHLAQDFESELLQTPENLDHVRLLHEKYVGQVMESCFLSVEEQPILNIIYTALQTALDVSIILRSVECTDHPHESLLEVHNQLKRAQMRFKNATYYLYKILHSKQRNDMLVHLDFNLYYHDFHN